MSVGAVNKQTGDRIPTAGMPAIDNALSLSSTNPVQNAVITNTLANKQDKTDNSLQTTDKTVVGAINEHEGDIDSIKSGLTNYQTQNDLNLEVPNRKNLFIGIYGANSTTVYSPVKPSTKYTISTKSTGASQINMQYIYTDDTIGGNAALCPSGATSNSITVTTPSNAKGIEIYAVADASAQSYASETQIELGSTATAYTPYIPSVESRIEAVESGLASKVSVSNVIIGANSSANIKLDKTKIYDIEMSSFNNSSVYNYYHEFAIFGTTVWTYGEISKIESSTVNVALTFTIDSDDNLVINNSGNYGVNIIVKIATVAR